MWMPPWPSCRPPKCMSRYYAHERTLHQYRLVRHLDRYPGYPADAGWLAAVHRAVRAAAGYPAVSHRAPADVPAQRPVRGAVADRQRPALAALHHPADRDDPGDQADYRHLPGRGDRKSV